MQPGVGPTGDAARGGAHRGCSPGWGPKVMPEVDSPTTVVRGGGALRVPSHR